MSIGSACLIVSAVAVAGCATPRASAAEAGSASATDTLTVITLERGACHGTCPIYRVQIAANGAIRFTGMRFVTPLGTDTARIASSAVTSLTAEFASRRFSETPTTIEYDAPACGSYVADLPTVELSLRRVDGTHRVRWDQGCRSHPPMLDTLAHVVDSVSGTSRWTTVARP